MLQVPSSSQVRTLHAVSLETDLAIAGGGMAGTCAAIMAARAGIRVVLVQDRPLLGGNASSEVRLWMLGATSHMGNNNRWAREGGVVDELLVENLYRNPEGNPLILDTILLEKVRAEANITLLLNTAVDGVERDDEADSTIRAITAFCPQNQTRYRIAAPLFCDASGDGIVAFLAGAAFRMGAEGRDEFNEGFAPEQSYGELLGHSLYFYSKDAGRPVRYIAPDYALKDITRIPRYRDVRSSDSGCRFWWFEYGGRMDTVHDTEEIKWELWKVAYGVWDYIKNSGRFPEADTLTLEWVGTIPGKRESRRFEGDYMLNQRDIVEQHRHRDAVSFGGWAMDLHPADGVYSELSPCTQWHSKGVYQIPYRCLYSSTVPNLFLAGRIISVSHVAFGSTRVMATCGHTAQVVGMAAALCRKHDLLPRDLTGDQRMHCLQQSLLRAGHYIPGVTLEPGHAVVTASSRYILGELAPDGNTVPLDTSRGMLLPLPAGPLPTVTFLVDADTSTELDLEVRGSSVQGNYSPDVTLYRQTVSLKAGHGQRVTIKPDTSLDQSVYVTYCLLRNSAVRVHISEFRVTGVLSLSQSMNKAVAKGARQEPPPGSGIDTFEFWLPSRRPGGHNLAITVDPPLDVFGPENVQNGVARPTTQTNAWVADPSDPNPRISLHWTEPKTIRAIHLSFDTDFDHPMESVLMGHPEREIPFCVKRYRITDAAGKVLFDSPDNHQTRNQIVLSDPIQTAAIHVEILETRGLPAAVFEIEAL